MTSSIIYFSMAIMMSVISISTTSMNGNYIRRTFYEMSPDVVSKSVFTIGPNGYYKPHFNKEILEECVVNYLNLNLKPKINRYKIGFSYLKVVNGEYFIDYEKFPQIVDIAFSCEYNLLYKFEGKINFHAGGIYNG